MRMILKIVFPAVASVAAQLVSAPSAIATGSEAAGKSISPVAAGGSGPEEPSGRTGVRQKTKISGGQLLLLVKQLMEKGEFEQARHILEQLRGPAADRFEILFLRGQIAQSQKRYENAVELFRAILTRRPGLARVRLELARTYFRMGRDRRARHQFDLALAGDLPPKAEENVRKYLSAMRKRKTWRLRTSFEITPDSNINAAPEDDSITLFGLPFQLSDAATRKSGLGLTTSVRGDYFFAMGKKVKLRAGGGVRLAEKEGSRSDSSLVFGRAGPRFSWNHTTISVLATANRRWFGERGFNRSAGGRIEADRRLSRRWRLSGAMTGESVIYDRSKSRNGPVFGVQGRATYTLGPSSFVRVLAGVARENSDAKARRNTSLRFGFGYFREIPFGFTVYMQPEITYRPFDAARAAFGKTREDVRLRLILNVIKRDLEFLGLSPLIGYEFTRNISNVGLFDFTRHRGRIGITRNF